MLEGFFRKYFLLGLLVAATCLLFAVSRSHLAGSAADDSFIHRRIALNYQQMGKPYFNLDQKVMVTSSPLWTVLLATAGRVLPVPNPVPWLELVFILAGAGTGYLLLLDRDATGMRSLALPAIAFALICLADFPSAVDQMETPCAVALVLAATLGILRQKAWAIPLLVLACFARYECVLLCAPAGVYITARRQWTRWSLSTAVGIALLGLSWLLFEYGTIIPNTVIAKSHLYAMTYRQVVRGFFSIPQALLCAGLGILWWAYGRSRRIAAATVLLFAFGASLGAAYVVRKTYIFAWYPPLVLVPLAIAILLWTDKQRVRATVLGALLAGSFLLPAAIADTGLLLAAVRGQRDTIPDFPLIARVHEYRRIGGALYSECPSGVLMTSEIGALGWSFRGEIRDGAGLASPEAIRYHPMRVPQERRSGTLGAIPAGFVRDGHPDLIVTYDVLAESALPAARSLGYVDYQYPLFVRGDRTTVNDLWGAQQMHVLVAPGGRCSPTAIDSAVRQALEQ